MANSNQLIENKIELDPLLPLKQWLTTREAAFYIGTTLGGIRNRVYRGELKPHKPFGKKGRSYFSKRDLDFLIGASQRRPCGN